MIRLNNLNNIQRKFLNDIQEVGMNIIFGEIEAEEIDQIFFWYADYLVDEFTNYMSTVTSLSMQHDKGVLTPDMLLMSLGSYTLYLEDDEEIDVLYY